MNTETTPESLAQHPIFDLLPPIFRECSADYVTNKYDSRLPFLRDGWVYATDGRICVRTPTTPELEKALATIPARKVPDASVVFVAHEAPALPLPPLPALPVCECCGGSGIDAARGTGVKVGGQTISAYFLWMLGKHGIAEVREDGGKGRSTFRFEAEGVQGAVMGLSEADPC